MTNTRKLIKGNVIFNQDDRTKSVVLQEREIQYNETFICERPHEDKDFSYLCHFEYCRCAQ